MPFGLKGAPATFQRMMDNLIRDLKEFADAYLDDLIIFSETWEEHLAHLGIVLERIRAAGLKIQLLKCQFALQSAEYLGHIIVGGEVKHNADKIKAVQACSVPKTKKEVRAFLGLAGYYRSSFRISPESLNR